MQNMILIRIDEITEENLSEKIKTILSKKYTRLYNSVNSSSDFAKRLCNEQFRKQKSHQLSPNNLQLDGLGALFFVIFIIVKVSLKFCQFYNNWKYCQFYNTTFKKAKLNNN